MNRRAFLKSALVGAVGIAVASLPRTVEANWSTVEMGKPEVLRTSWIWTFDTGISAAVADSGRLDVAPGYGLYTRSHLEPMYSSWDEVMRDLA
jgi:hypothetical protein